jgi:hypothetical protein
MYGDFPAKNTVYTRYILINVWFWPTLDIWHVTRVGKRTGLQQTMLQHNVTVGIDVVQTAAWVIIGKRIRGHYMGN